MECRSWLLQTVLLVILITFTVGQQNADFCDYQSPSMLKTVSLVATQGSDWSPDFACRCVVSPNFNISQGRSRTITLAYKFKYTPHPEEEETSTCLPMLQVETLRKSGSSSADEKTVTYSICPKETEHDNHYKVTTIMYTGQEVAFHLYNPGEKMIDSRITIHEFEGDLAVQCSPYERIMYEEQHCPCRTSEAGGGGGVGEATFDEKRRLMIGLVTAFVFLAVIIAIIVGAIFYKKRRARNAHRDKEAVTVENKAYQGSKQSVTDPKANKEANVSYAPDPNLNLKLQKPGHHGSKDSGLASSNDNNAKTLPFMQPNPVARSLENMNQMGVNYPSLAGQGSTSSLDNAVDPVYTTRPVKRPQNIGGPVDRNPQNYPSLAGHGSQSSLDHPRNYPGDGVDVYAKPLKRRPQQPEMSQSYDKLNIANAALANEETFHSAGSLNASRVTIETDI